MKLTEKQKIFYREYVKDFNATQAAIRAKYSAKTAYSQGQRLLKNAEGQEYLTSLIQKRNEKAEIDINFVLGNLQEILDRCMQHVPVTYYCKEDRTTKQLTDDNGCHVWTFESQASLRSLELIGKHLGMFSEQVSIKVSKSVDEELKLVFDALEQVLPEDYFLRALDAITSTTDSAREARALN